MLSRHVRGRRRRRRPHRHHLLNMLAAVAHVEALGVLLELDAETVLLAAGTKGPLLLLLLQLLQLLALKFLL